MITGCPGEFAVNNGWCMFHTMHRSDKILLLFILLLAGFLRFYRYSDFSFCNDEYMALERLRYGSFAEMIEKGATYDGHPPLVGSFLYYWIKIAGDSVAAVRLPFVIAGTISIFFVWLIASRWFNPVTGLVAALCMAALDYPLYYARITRPYSPGLLFSLMNLWFWTQMIMGQVNRRWLITAGYGLTAALCMYTHHFCFLIVLIAGIIGLFIVQKEHLKYYLSGAAVAFLLYIPGLRIFYVQFIEVGGLGAGSPFYWLAKPTPGYILDYWWICFNESFLIAILIPGIFVFSMVAFRARIRFTKFHLIALLLFVLPFLIGYFYSVFRSAVLQDRVLIFSFPYLLFFLSSLVPVTITRTSKISVLIALTVPLLYSTIIEKDFYNPDRYDQFPAITGKLIQYHNAFGDSNITAAANVFTKYGIDYHLNHVGRPIVFAEVKSHTVDHLKAFNRLVSESRTPYFLYAWISCFSPCEILQIIRKYYPYTMEREWHWKGELYLFSKKEEDNRAAVTPVFSSNYGFDSVPPPYWSVPDSVLSGTMVRNGTLSSVVYDRHPYSPTFSATLGDVFSSVNDILFARCEGYLPEKSADAALCLSLENQSGIYEWHSIDFHRFIDTAGAWVPVFIHTRVPKARSNDDIVKIFVWNTGEKKVYLDDFKVWTEPGNPVVFGRRNDHSWLDDR